jgi:hypothetical protein
MILQVFLVLVLQLGYFSFYYKFVFSVARIIRRRVCPVCFAAGSTWLTLTVLKLSTLFDVNTYLIAILLAESVVGVSYLVEEFKLIHKVKVPDYILKFGIIIYGTFAVMVFAFFSEVLGFALFAPVIIFGFYALTPNNGKHLAV